MCWVCNLLCWLYESIPGVYYEGGLTNPGLSSDGVCVVCVVCVMCVVCVASVVCMLCVRKQMKRLVLCVVYVLYVLCVLFVECVLCVSGVCILKIPRGGFIIGGG